MISYNVKLAEFIGIMLGDGSIGIYESNSAGRKTRQYRVKVSLNSANETEYADYISKLVEDLFGLRPLKRIKVEENTLDLLIFGKDTVNFLIYDVGMKLSPKMNRAKIPEKYFDNSFELMVLRGYFDTDGCLAIVNNNGNLYPRLEMKVCKSPMQRQFVDIIRRNGFRFGCYKIGNGSVRIQLNGFNEMKRWYKTVGFSNSRILKRYRKMVARVGIS
jgi:hypothetical protein